MKPTPEIRECLTRFSITRQIADDPNKLDMIARILKPVHFAAGEDIIRKGESGSEAFLLVEGTVEIIDFTMEQEPYIKAVLEDSFAILFGELGLIGSDVRTATVRARTACVCWMLGREDFLQLGAGHPQLGWLVLLEIANLLSERLKRTNQDVLQLFEALVMEVEGEEGG